MDKLSRRQLQRIRHFFREKEERSGKHREAFHHRAPAGDPRGRESVVRLMAGNVDRMVIVASFVSPPLKTGLIDRFLVIASVERVEPLVVFNKTDLLKTREDGERTRAVYRSLGYETLMTSTALPEGLEELREAVAGRTSLFAGHSGVGKSSLLNALRPGVTEHAPVREVSAATGKGRHATTTVRRCRIDGTTTIYDLPGLKLVSLYDLSPREIRLHFPELASRAGTCRFDDCLHIEEPDCGVKKALGEGYIERWRYDSYVRMVRSPRANL